MKIEDIKSNNKNLEYSHNVNLIDISKINCSGAFDVEFIQSNSANGFALILTDNKEILTDIELVASDSVLHIRNKNNMTVSINGVQIGNNRKQFNNFCGQKIFVNGQQIIKSGDGDQYNCFSGTQNIIKSYNSNNIKLMSGILKIFVVLPKIDCVKLSGAGSFFCNDISQESLEISLSGSGDISLSGKVKKIDVKLSGAGSINLKKLESNTAILKLSGVGKIKANVTESVTAKVSGVGDIKIYGNPVERDVSKSGMGKIKFK